MPAESCMEQQVWREAIDLFGWKKMAKTHEAPGNGLTNQA